ncbi:helicase-related protein [Halodesulfurarchaeum formicicum]|uniref:Helicase n=1 Tax=Halodesulfurarchaeum formicicum TaxID=1873524 RepID=A0A1J1AEA2_9EURY|nr:helicase-related protein [Halodesulfurarchaeum formicicum]APE96237.1 helicase [Halodesulfurarchaeum formicicum]
MTERSRFERPQFVDNRSGNTLATAINGYLEEIDDRLADDPDLDVVTGYFNPRGYFSVDEGLGHVDQVRLLIGAQPEYEGTERWRQPGDPLDEEYDQKRINDALQRLDENLEQDRNLLGFSREMDENLQDLVEFLNSDRVEIRRHEDRFIHGKAYLFSDHEGVIAGSSNFTGAGLNSNLELNLGTYDPHVTGKVQDWFDDLWNESEPFDLAGLYEERFEPYDPYLVYLRVLYERYGEELEEERDEEGGIGLTTFQEDGVRRANRFLDEHGGVIVADEVGLGKTYIAGELLHQYVHENRQRALVVAPAYLRDGMWNRKPSEWGIQFETISYAELRNDSQLGGDANNLDLEVDEYQLVVIDEAHAFRNPGTQQADALRRLLRGDPPKDVVMLTATPVNNSLWDLYYELNYFIKNDAEFAHEGIRSLRERFKQAQAEDPSDLSPDMLFDVLDETTVRRTRQFIKSHYENATMPDGEGGSIRISFPDQHPQRVDYEFSETFGDEYFGDIARGLAAADHEEAELTLARYRPSYYLEGEEDSSELSLVGLLRTGLLKRFESSSHAFANTLNRMIGQNRAALQLMDEGYFPDTDAIDEWMETDSDEAWDELLEEAEGHHIPLAAAETDPNQLRADLEHDIEILERWHDGARAVTREQDEKLHALRDTLHDVVELARKDAETEGAADDTVEAAFRQNRKVLLFSYYEDTVDWILDYLEDIVAEDDELSCYEGRIAGVSGDDSKCGVSREDAVYGFAPNISDAPPDATDDFDILVTTDVLGQGVNLQEARTVINYDLPWNPMRVVQRNGRIDRVNSPHSDIYPISFFPEDRLDELLELEHRVRRKLTQAARSIGVDSEVIPDMETLEQNFSDKLEEIGSIHNEEEELYEQGGTEAAAYSGEEYRQELRKGLQTREDQITSLPWAAGSGFKGENPGYFFCARIGDEVFMRFVPKGWDEIERSDDKDVLIQDTLTCLKRIECTAETDRTLPGRMRERVYDAWEVARGDIFQQWQEQTDPLNVQPDIRKLFREVGQHLRDHWPSEMTGKKLQTTVSAVEAPWPRRYERELREIFKNDALGPVEKSRKLVEKVDDLGLQPYEAPDPLPQLEEKEEVKLVTWMVVAPEENGTTEQDKPKLMSQMTFES